MMPLDDVTVVALEQAAAAPFATRQLADLGARVVKVERPGVGDFARGYDTRVEGLSSYFVWLNRGKESLTLDLKHPRGKEVLGRLLERADVFLHNLAPGAVGRLGFAAAELRSRHPGLIVCEVSGYGSSGPDRERKAYDLLIQAETGLVSVTGTSDEPCKVGISVADIAAGMYAFAGVLTALLQRRRSGEGAVVEVSLFDALAEWMSQPAYYTGRDSEPPPRSGARHAIIAPYGPFPCGRGGQVFLGIQNEREWARFCDAVLGRPELATRPAFRDNSARVEHREELQEIIEEAFGDRSAEQVLDDLEGAGIACARLRSVREFIEHPQLAARNRWRRVESPAGPLDALLPPAIIEGFEPAMDPVPALGEHTDAILREIGLGEAAIEELRRQEVV